jgi:ATP-dependent DNA helicase DinG
MGQVIAIKEATRVAAGDSALTYIDECYERLGAVPGFIARPGQRELSAAICKALVSGEPIAAEAPTGTGKTVAYLIGAIAAAEKLRTTKDIPIVVATATVGLQTQVLTGDLPRLVQAGIIKEGSALLAKGRGRYFCISNAERLVSGGTYTSQVDFFDETANSASAELLAVDEMLEEWHGNAWAGDIDSYSRPIGNSDWKKVQANSATCLGHKCEHYNACPFFNARRALSSARIVVANHDLVLSDLAMEKDGQDPLFPGRYILIFDEAHNLPDKALDIAAGSVDIPALLEEVPRAISVSRGWSKHPELLKLLNRSKLSLSDFDTFRMLNELEAVRDELGLLSIDEDTTTYRFERGALPEALAKALGRAQAAAELFKESLHDATRALKQSNLPEKNAALKPLVQELLFVSAGVGSMLGKLDKTLRLLTATERAVRWVERRETGLSLHTSPLDGADVLRGLVWANERVAVAALSATLQDFDGFERFKMRSGAPDCLRTIALPHIFPYNENTLYLVGMAHTPRQDERESYIRELCASMPAFIGPTEGTLVLFPSKVMMHRVTGALRAEHPGAVLCQGDMGVKELLKTHRARVEAGKGSILCGLATLAEGLDLPGKLCTHVIICALPFTVPTSPVERELQEVLGKDYFSKRALPDTLMRLIQMTGRLMRRETDRGRITVFDKRLHTTRWGQKLLGAIPGFKQAPVAPDRPPLHII